ncbi:MAG: adenosylcobinamide-phosphate synthase CbiB [Acidobacteriota bacterium]
MSPLLFTLAYLLDLVWGDPQWLPHPVRLIGRAIELGEKILRTVSRGRWSEFFLGMLLTVTIVGASVITILLLLELAKSCNHTITSLFMVYLTSTVLATGNLFDEVQAVKRLLHSRDLERARVQLARIVGRDTDMLDEPEIVRATIETLAESTSDGIVAPMFYLALGGIPAALGYKAINTLDSMIGHNDTRYRYFGKVAARLDDLANFVPARLTAILITFSAFISGNDAPKALRIWLRDGAKHASPNAGQVEAAMAGALGVRLGGLNFYGGEPHYGAYFGDDYRPLTIEVINSALIIVVMVSLFMFLIVLGWLSYWNDKLF